MSGTTHPGRMPSLLGLRWIAALGVFAVHATTMPYLFPAAAPVIPDAVGQSFYAAGEMAVSFFFVLSGFVLTWSARPGDTARSYLRRRFFRIYPTHLATAGLAIAIMLVTGLTMELHHVPQVLLLVQTWTGESTATAGVNGVSWSLAVEAFCYLLLPWLLPLVLRIPAARVLPVVAGVVALIAIVPVLGMLLPAEPSIPWNPAMASHQVWFVRYFPVTRLLEFVLGVLLARAMVLGRLPRVPLRLALGALAVSYAAGTLLQTTLWSIVATGIPAVAATVVAAAQADLGGRRWLGAHPTLVRLGGLSFAFYLMHRIVLETLALAWPPGFAWTLPAAVLMIAGALVISTLVAAALHHGLEQPIYRRFAKSGARRDRPVTEPAVAGEPAGTVETAASTSRV